MLAAPSHTWRVAKKLASGGFGDVYEAFTPEGERVAAKVLKNVSHSVIPLLENEIRTLSGISHPRIVRMIGFSGSSAPLFGEERGPCFWMEFVTGREIRDAGRASGIPDGEKLKRWLVESLEALDDIHRRGLVHGDVSPQNALVDGEGHVKIIDFGLSILRTRTHAKSQAANIRYLAPERIGGRILPAGDLYSLGILFYEAFAGKHPKEDALSLHDFLQKEALPLRDVLPDLPAEFHRTAAVIDGLVKNDIRDRYAAASEALISLESGDSKKRTPKTFHSTVFWGAETKLEELGRRMETEKPLVVLVHGGGGVGKNRFVRDLSLRAELQKIPFFLRSDLESLPPSRYPELFHQAESHLGDGNGLLVLEWNDRLLAKESREFFSRFSRWEGAVDVALTPLSRTDASSFLEMALPAGVASDFSSLVFEITGGVPALLLKAVDLILEVGDQAAFLNETERKRLLEKASWDRGAWLSTLTALPPEDADVLRAVAVGYEPCSLASFETLLPTAAASWPRLLHDRLVTIDLEGGRVRLGPAGLRAAILSALSAEQTKRFHTAWWKALTPEPESQPARLHHALSLGLEDQTTDLFFPVSDALWDQGRRSESLSFAERALDVVHDTVVRARLLKEKMNLQADRGDYEDALRTADEWKALEADNDPIDLKTVKYLFTTATHLLNQGRKTDAAERFRKALESIPHPIRPEFAALAARAHALLAQIYVEEGDLNAAKNLIEEGLRSEGTEDRHRSEFDRLNARIAAMEGDRSASIRFLERAKAYAEKAGSFEGLFATALLRGNLSASADEPDAAEDAYREALKLAESMSHELFAAQARNNLSILLRQRGRLEEALELAKKAVFHLRFLGKRRDFDEALKNLAFAQTSLGLWQSAGETALEIANVDEVREAQAFLEERRNGVWMTPPPDAPENDWNLERALRSAKAKGDEASFRNIVAALRKNISKTYRAGFEEAFEAGRNHFKEKSMTPNAAVPPVAWEAVSAEVNGLNRRLLVEDDMDKVLEGLMDAAMKIARARHGFLILADAGDADPTSPIEGFRVGKARNFDNAAIPHAEQALSYSVVRRAIETKAAVVTDNALTDARFKDSESIQLSQIKSIVALPLLGPIGVLGVFYLDHPLEEGLFGGEPLKALDLFAGVAGLALQKAQMIAGLKRSNADLSQRVDEQASEVELLQREVKNTRLVLKNEYSEIIGRSPRMLQALSLVDRLTDTKIPVWIFGESGTGKEAVARALHFNSARKNHPFVSENCSALPESLLESELFGHKKGAFTHATSDKKGLLQYADKGTVFLDEVADMPLNLQAKLLRFLQEGEVRPIGSTTPIKVDVRVISASNKDLANLVREGKFREDLYFRLNGITVKLPPLRERLEDLPLLSDHFLKKAAEREKKKPMKLHPKALKLLMGYAWPGNIRELQNTMETSALFAEGNFITVESLRFKDALFGAPPPAAPMPPPSQPVYETPPVQSAPPSPPPPPAKTRLQPDLERLLIAIRDNCFNKASAAKALGMSRRHLYTKLEGYGVKPDEKTLKNLIEKHLS